MGDGAVGDRRRGLVVPLRVCNVEVGRLGRRVAARLDVARCGAGWSTGRVVKE